MEVEDGPRLVCQSRLAQPLRQVFGVGRADVVGGPRPRQRAVWPQSAASANAAATSSSRPMCAKHAARSLTSKQVARSQGN